MKKHGTGFDFNCSLQGKLRYLHVHLSMSIWGPLTLKFDRATRPVLKFDRRHWTCLRLTGIFLK